MIIKNDNLASSVFDDVNMAGTTFQNVKLFQSRFDDVNLSEARFHNINFSDVEFTAAQIGGTTFRHIGPPPDRDGHQPRQRPVTFDEAILCDSLFRKVDLSNVRIVDCNVAGMTIDGILVSELLELYRKQHG